VFRFRFFEFCLSFVICLSVIRHFPPHGSLAKSNAFDGRDGGTDVRAVSDPRGTGVVVRERLNPNTNIRAA